jgi:polyphosphate kinase
MPQASTASDPQTEYAEIALNDPSLYFNRELSLLAFQWRVLEEAQDRHNLLLERAKFLSILISNLDEFFMVRFAGVKQQIAGGVVELGPDGRSPITRMEGIRAEVTRLSHSAYRFYRDELIPDLSAQNIEILQASQLTGPQRAAIDTYFAQTVFAVLTPLAFDPGRPFPHMSNLSLNLAVVVRDAAGEEHFARVKVPDTLPQLVPVPVVEAGKYAFVWLEDLIVDNLQMLFPGLDVLSAFPFHITRDAEQAIQEIESDDLLETIEEAVWRRRFRAVVRLQVNSSMPEDLLALLIENFELTPQDVYRVDGPLDLGRLKALNVDRPDLKDKTFQPLTPFALHNSAEEDIFSAIRKEDILLHHPYESFQPVVDFLKHAAKDPNVLAIKMTLYRVGSNSPIVAALLDAVENGKQVAVLLELKARFDEESNIEWARALEREGVHVVYGLVGLKVHSKLALVVRREGDAIRRYVHMATGNYNATTARVYTDLSFFTANDEIGADVSDLFNYLTGYSAKEHYRKLLVAPINLQSRLQQLIKQTIEGHREKGGGHIILKANALEDPRLIEPLYQASRAGVKVDLIIRGICCLRPGIEGVSENIRVVSIIGRFLEHSRIYYFHHNGKEEVYLGSADLMPRNLTRRVEIAFPVENEKLVRRVRDEILATSLADNWKARFLNSDGTYEKRKLGPREKHIDSQATFLQGKAHK